jgi:hypothetical protein
MRSIFLGILLGFIAAMAWSDTGQIKPGSMPEVFDTNKIKGLSGDLFTFDVDGTISDGPRQTKDAPVDYSLLLSDEYIKKEFLTSVMGCSSCENSVFKWPNKELTIRILPEPGGTKIREIWKISQQFRKTLDAAGFSTPPAASAKEADVIILIGSHKYLKEVVGFTNDPSAIEYYSRPISEQYESTENWGFDGQLYTGESCFLSLAQRKNIGQIFILLHPGDMDKCLPGYIFRATGLGTTSGYLPSLTNDEMEYSSPTLLDFLFLDILYSPDFPLTEGRANIAEFVSAYFDSESFEDRMKNRTARQNGTQ